MEIELWILSEISNKIPGLPYLNLKYENKTEHILIFIIGLTSNRIYFLFNLDNILY